MEDKKNENSVRWLCLFQYDSQQTGKEKFHKGKNTGGQRQMNTVLMVLKNCYADWEAAYLAAGIQELGGEGFQLKTVSWSSDPVVSMGGFHVCADYSIDSCPKDFAGIILIGGTGWREEDAGKIKPILQEAENDAKVIGGICDAAAFLGTAGILNTVFHTCNDREDMKAWAGAVYSAEEKFIPRQCVRDRGIVTANGTAALEFARDVMLELQISDESTILKWYQFHKKGFYAQEGENSGNDKGIS